MVFVEKTTLKPPTTIVYKYDLTIAQKTLEIQLLYCTYIFCIIYIVHISPLPHKFFWKI